MGRKRTILLVLLLAGILLWLGVKSQRDAGVCGVLALKVLEKLQVIELVL